MKNLDRTMSPSREIPIDVEHRRSVPTAHFSSNPSDAPHHVCRARLDHPADNWKRSRIVWRDYETGNHRAACPACGRGARDKTLGITIGPDGRGVAHCFRCNHVEKHRPDGARRQWLGKPAAPPVATHQRTTLSDYGHEVLRACRPIHGAAQQYLEARRCVIPPEGGDLRFHPNLKHPSGYSGPALVGLITDVETGRPMSLHRTWIRADGHKAELDPPRLLLGGHRKQGGVIRLWPDEYLTHGLAVCEGVETALSLAHAYQPVWCLIDAGNLGIFSVLPGIEVLLIGRDNDAAGICGAAECAARWTAAGAEVRITQQAKNDLNDELQQDEVTA